MSSERVIIDVRELSKCYEIYHSPRDRLKQLILPGIFRAANRVGIKIGPSGGRTKANYFREFWALRDVSFQVHRGETLGIIGRNGSGKSTLLQILAGILRQTSGDVTVNGRVAALLELGSGFNGEYTGRENVYLNGQILGLSRKAIDARYAEIVDFADIGEFIDEPVKTYSSGMFLRLAFAVQAHIDASVVIIDEALAVGDVFFRQKCYARLEQLRSSGAAIVLVSHSMPDIEQYCTNTILLDHGRQEFIGSSSDAAKHYYLLNQASRTPHGPTEKRLEISISSTTDDDFHDRPAGDAFLDLSSKTQIGNNQARCAAVALCNEAGEACNSFAQGDLAVFYYEFELFEDIGVPICGTVIKNDRGIIVHGKNSWQFGCGTSYPIEPGSRIVCKHEIKLDIAPGEYLFEIGLASVSYDTWTMRRQISHEEMSLARIRNCHLSDVGSFSVGLARADGISVLSHHGIANLPGKMTITVCKP